MSSVIIKNFVFGVQLDTTQKQSEEERRHAAKVRHASRMRDIRLHRRSMLARIAEAEAQAYVAPVDSEEREDAAELIRVNVSP